MAGEIDLLAGYQRKDGSWLMDVGESTGSPAIYGACLATYECTEQWIVGKVAHLSDKPLVRQL